MKSENMKTIGRRIRRQREGMDMIREDFAYRVGISPQFLSDIEHGRKGMSAETLFRLCKAFDLSADYVLFGRAHEGHSGSVFDEMLDKVSPDYMPLLEDIVIAFLNTIEKAETKKEE